MLLRAYRAAGLRVNLIRDNIEMEIKEMAPMTSGTNLIWSIYKLKITVNSQHICLKTMNTLTTWFRYERPPCPYSVWYRLLMFSYATLTAHRYTQNRVTFLRSSSKELVQLTSHYTTNWNSWHHTTQQTGTADITLHNKLEQLTSHYTTNWNSRHHNTQQTGTADITLHNKLEQLTSHYTTTWNSWHHTTQQPGTADITLHNKSRFLSHTNRHLIKLCVYSSGKLEM